MNDIDAALRELAQLRAVFDVSPIMFWVKDTENNHIRVNAAAAALEGTVPARLEGRSGWELYPKEQADAYFQDDQEVIASGRPKLHIIEPHTAVGTGELRWLQVGKAPIRGADGQVVGVLAFAVDMTERHALEDRLRRLYEQTPAMLHSIDAEGRLLTVSDAWLSRLGYTREEVLGRPSVEFLTEASRRRAIEEVLPGFFVTGRCDEVSYQMLTRQGETIDVQLSAILERDHTGAPLRSMAVIQDVTLRLRAERALQEERNRLARALRELADSHELLYVTLESIGDAVITTDADEVVQWLNPVAERLTGWATAEAQGRPLAQIFHLVHETTRQPIESPVAVCLSQSRTIGAAEHTLLIARGGAEFGIEDSASPIRDRQGELLGAVLVFRDVTEQRRLSGEMTWRASHDALTGLLNRTELELRLGRLLRQSKEDHSQHALLYIDLDQFKLVNDACGHSVGDQLLQQVSQVLAECIRSRDTLARLGGDEFGVILEFCGVEHAQRVAQTICDRMEEFRFFHEHRPFRVGASIGLVPLDQRWTSTAAVLQAADTSCYAAKEAGRNRVHLWLDTDRTLRARQGEMQWATRLAQALDEDRFQLYAQKITPLSAPSTGLHCEVLLRLREPDGSLVAPGAFLPAAERFHLATRIDRWVVRAVLDRLTRLPSTSSLATVAVNLSGHSIGDRAFHRFATQSIRSSGLDPTRLCFEITETAAITNLADATAFIEEMRRLGVRIALDDFGAGASSFGYLKVLPVDLLKIDGQFIRDLVDDPLDAAAVRCFRDVARVIGVKTVAESVEREDVLAIVREIGIDLAQGMLLHRPEPLDSLLRQGEATPQEEVP